VGSERHPRIVGDDERDARAAQQLIDVVGEPARVAKLEAVAAGRKDRQRPGEALVVALEVWRELP